MPYLVGLLLLHACSDRPEREDTGVTVRDSAGVQIVEHSAAHLASLPTWTIDTVPLQDISGDRSDTQFTQIGEVVQRTDGGFYIADRRLRDIRSFSADGSFERIVAASGRGPGEVGFVSRLQLLAGDSLAFVDGNHRRFSVLAPEGRYARQVEFPRFQDGTTVGLSMQLGDGRLLGTMRKPWTPAPENRDSVYRAPYAIVAFRAAGGRSTDTTFQPPLADTVAVVPDGEAYRANSTEGGETWADEYPLRFGRSTVMASDGHRIFIATNESAEIIEYGLRGMVRRIRSDRSPRPVSESDRTRLEASVLAGLSTTGRTAAQRAEIEAMVKGWQYATRHTFAWRLLAGTDGSLWVEDTPVVEDDARRYLVYDASGRAVATVHLPPRVRALQVRTDVLVGVRQDDDDVPNVARWRIVPSVR